VSALLTKNSIPARTGPGPDPAILALPGRVRPAGRRKSDSISVCFLVGSKMPTWAVRGPPARMAAAPLQVSGEAPGTITHPERAPPRCPDAPSPGPPGSPNYPSVCRSEWRCGRFVRLPVRIGPLPLWTARLGVGPFGPMLEAWGVGDTPGGWTTSPTSRSPRPLDGGPCQAPGRLL